MKLCFTLLSVGCWLSVVLAQWEPDRRLTLDSSASRIWANNGWFLVAIPGGLQAVWWDARDGHPEVYGARSTDSGEAWEPDRNLSPGPESTFCPSLAVSDSDIHLVYKDRRGGWGAFYRRSTDAGATWSGDTALVRFDSPTGGCMTDAAWGRTVHVLWAVFHGAFSQVSHCRSLDRGVSWDPEVLISHDTFRSEDPSVAVSESIVHVVWFDTRNGPGDAYYERSLDNGTTWGPETRLTPDSAIVYAPTVAALDSFVHVAWIDRRSGSYHFQIYYKRSTDAGTTWSPETRLCDNSGAAMFPVLAASGRNVHVAWYDNRTGRNQLYYRVSTDCGSTWQAETTLTESPGNAGNPAIAVADTAIHLIWTDDRDGHYETYYKRNLTGNVGVEDIPKPQAPSLTPAATIVRKILFQPPSVVSPLSSLLSIDGRKVMALRPGTNDVTRLAPGVYFVRLASSVDKVIVTK